jgi:hypothetical protein
MRPAASGAVSTTTSWPRACRVAWNQPSATIARSFGLSRITCTIGGIPRSWAKSHTARSASGTGRPGSPTASALFARPVNPSAQRSRQSPKDSSTRGGHALLQAISSVSGVFTARL